MTRPRRRQNDALADARKALAGDEVLVTYILSPDQAYRDKAVRAALEADDPAIFKSVELAEAAGFGIELKAQEWDNGQIYASWLIDVPPQVDRDLLALAWDNGEEGLRYTLTRSTRHPGWQLTTWADDGLPWGHAEIYGDASEAFDTAAQASGVPLMRLRQVMFRDGRVLVRAGAERIQNPKEQIGLFGEKQAEVEGFALTSPKGRPSGPVRPASGTQRELVSRKVSRAKMEEMRERELKERAAKKRSPNPERWLAPRLSKDDRTRLKRLHDVYFPMFEELESLPGAELTTPTAKYTVPEGYALLLQIGNTYHAFFQDAAPLETWSFITISAQGDSVDHPSDYLDVLEEINERVLRATRGPNPRASSGREDALHVTLLKRRLLP